MSILIVLAAVLAGCDSDHSAAIVPTQPEHQSNDHAAAPAQQATPPAVDLGMGWSFTESGEFSATFDQSPGTPQAWQPGDWDVQKHVRGPEHWAAPEPVHAQHGPDCAGPPATHHATTWDDLLFLCRDHLMTALNASDYGLIYFTPPALVDFSQGPAVVQWDMSTERMSKRDWIDVTISPWEDNVARPLLSDLSQGVDLQGPPRNALHVSNDNAQGAPTFKTVRDGVVRSYNNGETVSSLDAGIMPGTNQAATRQTFRLTVERTRIRFERLSSATAPALVYWNIAIPDTGWTHGVVQFGHHSYTPEKDDAGVPATWHWDNVQISPAARFTIRSLGMHLIQSDSQQVTLPQAAPAGSMLRFAATTGPDVQVAFDNGPFQPAQRANQPVEDRSKAVSYWTPVPAGTRSIRFKGQGGWWGDEWRIEDPHLWAPGG